MRSTFIRQVTRWHWVSSGICLGGMLLFTITGITLHHSSAIPASPVVTRVDVQTPPPVRAAIGAAERRHALPGPLAAWLKSEFGPAGASRLFREMLE